MGVSSHLNSFLCDALGESVAVRHSSSVSGGCIHNAMKIELNDGRCFFLKENRADRGSLLAAEFKGLKVLEESGAAKVPSPIQSGTQGDRSYLLMEWIEPGPVTPLTSQRLGEMLANLHLVSTESRFGLDFNNSIGSTPQANEWCANWPEFFISRRLESQFRLAQDNGHSINQLANEGFWNRLEAILDTDVSPSLLHGDLWSGNYLIGQGEQPYLIDPAPYWGHHEAEFGILTMFGGFDREFFEAYHSRIPMAEGFEQRLSLYQLYHYLNHLNIFGSSYLGQCQRLIKEIASA